MKWLWRALRQFFHSLVMVLWSIVFDGRRVLVVTPDFYMRDTDIGRMEKPTVVRCRVFVRDVVANGNDIVFTRRVQKSERGSDIEAVRFADRGVTWCYGWRDEDVKALHALATLDACVES